MEAKKLIITQVRSGNRCLKEQKETLRCLGLGRIGRSVEQVNNAAVVGMVRAIAHLVKVQAVN